MRHPPSVTALGEVVEAVLRACEEDLLGSSIETLWTTPESVRSLLDTGEDVVAYEILCDNLYEDDIEIPPTVLLRLRDAVEQVGADTRRLALWMG